MRDVVGSIEGEYRRYKQLGDAALGQVPDEQLSAAGGPASNSIAAMVWHVSGNLASRFTDFLHSDGEKPWRDRESEFERRTVSRAELGAKWEEGWRVLFTALSAVTDAHLAQPVAIRGVALPVVDALHRSLAHTAYHVGQIVFLAKALRGDEWKWLTIPPGGSGQYNQNPAREKPPARG
jgi:hypothetical protein